MILEAAQFARICHVGQYRKYTGDPYIYHPARVAARAMLLPMVPEYVVAAAWVHDVIEDCLVLYDDLVQRFGSPTANLVRELTNPSKGSKLPREKRKEADRRHLMEVSFWAKCLKALDRIDNLRELSAGPVDFKRLYGRESVLLGDALLIGPHGAHDTLVQLVGELYKLAIPLRNAA